MRYTYERFSIRAILQGLLHGWNVAVLRTDILMTMCHSWGCMAGCIDRISPTNLKNRRVTKLKTKKCWPNRECRRHNTQTQFVDLTKANDTSHRTSHTKPFAAIFFLHAASSACKNQVLFVVTTILD